VIFIFCISPPIVQYAEYIIPESLIKRNLTSPQKAEQCADYVLFDTWFSNPAQLIAVKNLGLDSIAMIKKSSRIYYEYKGEQLSISKIFGICKKRRGRSKYLLSVDVMVGKDQKIPAKIVCVRNRKNKKDWVAFICTKPDLSEEEIIRIYGKSWQIEVFFKTCKSYLQLVTECHSLSYDALTAHVAIVFTRYLMIAMEQRRSEDERTLGELFFFFTDELKDISFGESFRIIITAMIDSVCAVFQPTEEQYALFIETFVGWLCCGRICHRLPLPIYALISRLIPLSVNVSSMQIRLMKAWMSLRSICF
jgi:hypothetical protein